MKPETMSTPDSERASRALGEFRNEVPPDWSKPETFDPIRPELARVRRDFPFDVPLVIDGQRHSTAERLDSVDPCNHRVLVARSASGTAADADKAVSAASRAFRGWSRTPAEERAAILLRAAAVMRRRKHHLAAILLCEAGKAPREAVADVDEAIDFLEYYAREAMHFAEPFRLQPGLRGETNDFVYTALGVVAVIGPWNFPLAIPTGMCAAAIATGNTVVLKPAEQTPLIARYIVEALEEAGLPPGVLNLLPGRGEVVGARLVEHPGVHMVVFTGSREVGVRIAREASILREGQKHLKRVVTEMGGKNAIIVDVSADIDRSIRDVLYSAFGFSGQKCSACSRLILHTSIHAEYMARLGKAMESVVVGPVDDQSVYMGAVIDAGARDKVRQYIEIGRTQARTHFIGDVSAIGERGYFVPPALFEVESERHPLMQEEVFGPVLTVMRARDFDDALRIANSTDYALTGGVHSQTREHLDRARLEYEVGNLYLNRSITGAIVGRQPFGGFRLSGIGTKAGGPDYLRQFLVTRVATERLS